MNWVFPAGNEFKESDVYASIMKKKTQAKKKGTAANWLEWIFFQEQGAH